MRLQRNELFLILILIIVLFCSCSNNKTERIEVLPAETQLTASSVSPAFSNEATTVPTPQEEKQLIVISGETTAGTGIVDKEKSSFSLSDVDMIDTPLSSCFSEVGYSFEHEILVVTFRDSGSTYIYMNFPESMWESFINADSLGKFYNSNIKGEFVCYKL